MKAGIVGSILLIIAMGSFAQKPPQNLKAAMERGKQVYDITCITCHQADGLGVQRMNPPLVKTKWVLGDKKKLATLVLKGLKGGEIIIDGDDFHNPMPPQEAVLSDLQIADVLTYVRNSFGNKASAVTEAEVKAARSAADKPAPAAPKKAVHKN